MSDETTQATEQAQEEVVITPSVEELQAQLAETLRLAEIQKNEIAGLNRKVSEEQKTLQELKQKSMTDEELKQAQLAEMQNALISTYKETVMLKNEIPSELAGLVKGDNKTDIEANAKVLADFRLSVQSGMAKEIEDLKKQVEEFKVKGQATGVPKTGSTSIDTSKLSITEATELYRKQNGLT